MKPTKHTPGPWTVAPTHLGVGVSKTAIRSGGETDVCFMNEIEHEVLIKEREANARLIAAAPDLLEALTEIALECETADADALVYLQGILRTANKALAKARGES